MRSLICATSFRNERGDSFAHLGVGQRGLVLLGEHGSQSDRLAPRPTTNDGTIVQRLVWGSPLPALSLNESSNEAVLPLEPSLWTALKLFLKWLQTRGSACRHALQPLIGRR